MTFFFTLPWRGRVVSGRASDARRGGVTVSQPGYRSKGETATPPRRSFHSRRPRERASLVSTPPGEGKRTSPLSARESAAVLLPGRSDHFQILIGTRYRRARGEDVPLVFDLVGGQRGDRIHLMHQLMIRCAEVTLPRLEQIVFCALLEVLDDGGRCRRFDLVDGLRHDLGGDVVAPGLVLRRLGVFPGEGRDECPGAGRFQKMMPDHRPGADEVALAGGPGQR